MPLVEGRFPPDHFDVAVTVGDEAMAGRRAFERLSWQDMANLVIEARDTPMHMGVVTVLEAGPEPPSAEELLAQARTYVASRLDRLPEFRQALYWSQLLAERPLWVDDPHFDVGRHVLEARVPPPGGDTELFGTIESILQRLLDRRHPLWEIWVLTGLRHNRFALLLKVHHAVTDGIGMLRIAEILFDTTPQCVVPDVGAWTPTPAPSWGRLTMSVAADTAGGLWRGMTELLHPVKLGESTVGLFTTIGSITSRTWTGGRARLRHPIGPRRKMAVIRLNLAAVKRVAHAHGATVNDVVLDLAAAGVAAALRSRGETTDGVVLRGLIAVNPPVAPALVRRNRAGSVVVSLPVDEPATADRLHAIAAESRRARRWQSAAVIERVLVLVARTRVARFLSRHQGAIELAVSNLKGPTVPIYFTGRKVVDVIPITPISGNVTIDFCALSYAGRFNIGLLADAASWPDLDVTVQAMRSSWHSLRRQTPADVANPAPAARLTPTAD